MNVDESFSEPQPNVIQSTSGFSVQVHGRTGLSYIEGSRMVQIDAEVLASPRTIAIYANSIAEWRDTNGSAPMTQSDRRRVANNIKRAFRSCGYELQLIPDWERGDR